MPISEHERQILQDLENDLLGGDPRATSSLGRPRLGVLLGALSGIVTGFVLVFIGLGLDSMLGTWLGVAGFLAILAGARVAVTCLAPGLRSHVNRRLNVHAP
jgi:hypothetical protein